MRRKSIHLKMAPSVVRFKDKILFLDYIVPQYLQQGITDVLRQYWCRVVDCCYMKSGEFLVYVHFPKILVLFWKACLILK